MSLRASSLCAASAAPQQAALHPHLQATEDLAALGVGERGGPHWRGRPESWGCPAKVRPWGCPAWALALLGLPRRVFCPVLQTLEGKVRRW